MKESSSRESVLSIDAEISGEELGKLTEELLGVVYSSTYRYYQKRKCQDFNRL
jgi:hypothetical protein